jgi:DNA processing protein
MRSACVVAADPERECRAGDLPQPHQPFRLRAGRLDAIPDLSRRGGASRALRITPAGEAEAEMEAAERLGARFVGLGEPDYPPWLRHADAPPPLLAVRGAQRA